MRPPLELEDIGLVDVPDKDVEANRGPGGRGVGGLGGAGGQGGVKGGVEEGLRGALRGAGSVEACLGCEDCDLGLAEASAIGCRF